MKRLIDLGTRLMIRSSRPLDSNEESGEKDQPISQRTVLELLSLMMQLKTKNNAATNRDKRLKGEE